MKKLLTLLMLVGGLVISTGCKDENAQYKPTPDAEPKIPAGDSREGDEETFLPPQHDQ